MSVRVGSARSDENRQLVNGIKGDQRQTNVPDMTGEVSMEPWYMHPKGWYVIRAKDAAARQKIAYAMEAACNNPRIGYSQSDRWTAQDWCKYNNKENYDPAKITANVNVDCSALVRLCCKYAGIETGDIYTSIMPKTLGNMAQFDLISDTNITNSCDNLMAGDILVTRSTGHTVVVLDDGPNIVKNAKYVYNGIIYDNEFDPEYYANKYEDLKKAFGTDAKKLLQHWVEFGKKESRIAKEVKYIYNGIDYTNEFDPNYYSNKYEDLKKAFGTDVQKLLQHWVEFGKKEGRVAKAPVVQPQPEPQPQQPAVSGAAIGIAKTSVTVRNASNTKGKVVGYVSKGQEVKIIEQLSNGWLKIEWPKAEHGYAFTSNRNGTYYEISKTSKFPYTVEITASALFIRKGPGTEYATVGTIKAGERYVITAIENEKWAKMQDGRGYFSMAYAKEV